MENQVTAWVLSLVAGGIGGNLTGAGLKQGGLGSIGNTLAGVVGGGLGAPLLTLATGATFGSNLGVNVASAGIGGAALVLVVGLIRQSMAKA